MTFCSLQLSIEILKRVAEIIFLFRNQGGIPDR